MFLQQIFDWLVDPAGGGQYLTIALASLLVEAQDFWKNLSSQARSRIIGVLSAGAVVLAVYTGQGDIDGLFANGEAALVTVLTTGAVWLVSQAAHALNPRR